MNSGEIFNWKRFRLLLGFEMTVAFRRDFATVAVFGLVPAIVFVLSAIAMELNGVDGCAVNSLVSDAVAAVTSVLFFLFFPIMRYGAATDRSVGSSRLMLPASHTEKFICMIIVAVIVFPIIFASIYLGTDWLMYRIFPEKMEISLAEELVKDALAVTERTFKLTYLTKLFLPFLVSSAGLCGAFLFKKSKKVKTFITSAASFILVFLTAAVVFNRIICDADIVADLVSNYAKPAWLCFQTLVGMCSLTYVFFKSKNLQL